MTINIHNDGKCREQSWEAVYCGKYQNLIGFGRTKWHAIRDLVVRGDTYLGEIASEVQQMRNEANAKQVEE